MKTGPLLLAFLGALHFILSACANPGAADPPETIKFYVGSGGWEQEYSIFLCEMEPVTCAFSVLDSFAGATGSSYLAMSPDGTALFATSNESVPEDKGHNSVTSFRINPENYSLEPVSRRSSEGNGPCHVQVSPQGDYLFAANYGSGHAAALPVNEKGLMEPASSVVRGEGSGPVESRQEGPHAHQVMMDPEGKFLLVPDLGTDKVMNYAFDRETGRLSPNPEQACLEMIPGAGPRHLAFHPSGEFVYILNELNATVTACKFDPATGVLSVINRAGIVEDSFTGNRQAAAVRVHPTGNFIYASNRDDESNLAVFRKEDNGGISRIQIVEDVPYWPRDFNITPDGKYLIAAGARSDVIELFNIDPQTGLLSKTGTKTGVPSPTCILFIGHQD